jgi:hypothetical protein
MDDDHKRPLIEEGATGTQPASPVHSAGPGSILDPTAAENPQPRAPAPATEASDTIDVLDDPKLLRALAIAIWERARADHAALTAENAALRLELKVTKEECRAAIEALVQRAERAVADFCRDLARGHDERTRTNGH